MDSTVLVLLQAAATVGNAALDEVSRRAIGDAWDATKTAIKRRLGADHPAPAVLDNLRDATGNGTRMASLQAQLVRLELGHDPEVLAAIDRLAGTLQQHRQGATVTATLVQGAMIVNGPQTNHF